MEIRKAAAELRAIWAAGNEYLQAAAPWATFKDDPGRAAAAIRLAINLIRLYAILSRPFVPDASDAMLAALGVEGDAEAWPADIGEALSALPAGHGFTVPENLFAKISDEAREEMEARFAGS
jgi:methionyl-tRNA synthetase